MAVWSPTAGGGAVGGGHRRDWLQPLHGLREQGGDEHHGAAQLLSAPAGAPHGGRKP